MSQRICNAFLVLGAVCFLAMASGAVLHLHLAHVADPAKHDAGHCPLCQQLLVTKKYYSVEIESAHVDIDRVGHVVETCPDNFLPQAIARQSRARAPPA